VGLYGPKELLKYLSRKIDLKIEDEYVGAPAFAIESIKELIQF
jgi:hypothetical protein